MAETTGLLWEQAGLAGGGAPLVAGDVPVWYQTVGTVLAVSSGFFIGVSLILQKKGLIDTNEVRISTGNEYAYLKSRLWWVGIVCSTKY
jgi:hypothetical protein